MTGPRYSGGPGAGVPPTQKLSVSGIQIDFEAGETYADGDIIPPETEEERRRRRREKRQAAIEQFRKAAVLATLKQMDPLVQQLAAMCIQLRSLGGTGVESNLPGKLREAADFLEEEIPGPEVVS